MITTSEEMDREARRRFEEACNQEERRINDASDQLHECPFCGSPETVIDTNRDDKFVGFCNNCHAAGPPCEYLENAVSGWNHREPLLRKEPVAVPGLPQRQKPRLVPAA